MIDCDTTDFEDTKKASIFSESSYPKPAPSPGWKAYKYLFNMLKASNTLLPGDWLARKVFGVIYDSNP